MRRFLALVTMTALLLPATALPASASDRRCVGRMRAITVDNLRVPNGRSCTLVGTRVRGNITVAARASLVANRIRVDGNIQATRARRIIVRRRSFVDGNIQIKRSGPTWVAATVIEGDLQVDNNRRRTVALRNRIDGNLQAVSNRGGLLIRRNRIDGDLQCKQNRPAPRGGGNIVDGDKEGQCRRL